MIFSRQLDLFAHNLLTNGFSTQSSVNNNLKKKLQQQTNRRRKAEKEQPTILSQTVYVGTLGLIFIIPVIAGAYLGAWLDEKLTGYSISWTMSLIVTGVFVGGLNVFLFIREKNDE